MWLLVIGFLLGLLLLVLGAEALIKGATKLAVIWGLPPLIIGLTVVAFGTSAPELFVSVMSALQGNLGLSVGNVVGSNIFNVLFILGLSALIIPLCVHRRLIRYDVPIMILASMAFVLCAWWGLLNPVTGCLFLSGLVFYTYFTIRMGKQEANQLKRDDFVKEYSQGLVSRYSQLIAGGLVLVGIILLVLGGHFVIENAVAIARHYQINEFIIGVTIVAIGTSLPELTTSVIASLKEETDIAVGNIVGSNIFNILGVLGASLVVSGTGFHLPSDVLLFDMIVMLLTAMICFPIFYTGHTISRSEGGVMMLGYCLYVALLFHTVV